MPQVPSLSIGSDSIAERFIVAGPPATVAYEERTAVANHLLHVGDIVAGILDVNKCPVVDRQCISHKLQREIKER